MYIVKPSQHGLWTVGSYGDHGTFRAESVHATEEAADQRAALLNQRQEPAAPPLPAMDAFTLWDLFAAAYALGAKAGPVGKLYEGKSLAFAAAEFADAMMAQRAKRNGGAR